MIELAFALFFSHILTDFYLQPNSWVEQKFAFKHKAWQLYAHATLAGLLAVLFYSFLGSSKYLDLSKFIILWFSVSIPHFCIDLWKLNQTSAARYFILDQLFHVIHLGIVYFCILQKPINNMEHINLLYKSLIVFGAFLLLMAPTGILIGILTKPFQKELNKKDASQSLPKAGKMIGYLERTFILVFVLLGHFSSIGFLISAKAILRFSDNKTVENPVRMSEYVIIGTLMSFLSATLVGLVAKFLLEIIA